MPPAASRSALPCKAIQTRCTPPWPSAPTAAASSPALSTTPCASGMPPAARCPSPGGGRPEAGCSSWRDPSANRRGGDDHGRNRIIWILQLRGDQRGPAGGAPDQGAGAERLRFVGERPTGPDRARVDSSILLLLDGGEKHPDHLVAGLGHGGVGAALRLGQARGFLSAGGNPSPFKSQEIRAAPQAVASPARWH